ncbi:zinc finger MYM-type protein 2-like [Rhizophagus irregularis DAOM 181602=DAOM 197198]|nr:zinc finger MYM-type protein 2-like [Rhizophagus irregularis DAOM 181602=DAOM 197198]GBC38174.2 zinc finger MYM-type protein 2-like [Rhizophagus irregularis DAOM 181602=DAOM 197198]
MSQNFKKASELLHSKNNIDVTDKLKENFTHLQNVNISNIHEISKPSIPKESYERPSLKTLQRYVTKAKPENTKKNTRLWFSRFEEFVNDTQPDIDLLTLYDKKVIAMLLCEFIVIIKTREKKDYKANSLYNGICAINRCYQELFKDKEPFNIHEDFEFGAVRDTLHTRMIELEDINNGKYNGADALTDDEMVKIFEHPNMSNETPDGLLKRVFLWVGCCTAQRGGSYYNLMAEHFKERDDGGFDIITIHDKTHQGGYYHRPTSNQTPTHIIPPDESKECGACYDIKKYLNLRPKNAEKNFFLHVNKDPEDIKLGKWYSSQHMGRDKLSRMLKEICTITSIDCTNRRVVNHSLRKRTAQKLNDEGLDPQAIMNVTLHKSLAGLNSYRSQNEIQKLEVAKLTLPGVHKDTEKVSDNIAGKTLSEIQNISIPLKRKDKNLELAENFKLKFIKCANITINITKE